MTAITNGGAAGAAGTAAVAGAWAHHGRHGHNPIEAVSSLLGMDPADITSQLSSGKSLDDIATEHGVSHQDLVNAIASGMPRRMRDGADATEIAERIAARKGLPARPPSGAGGPDAAAAAGGGMTGVTGVIGSSLSGAQQKMLDDVSSLLGEDTDSLLQQLRGGASLLSLAAAKGVDSSNLAGVLQDGILFDTSV